jgi:hypothetical protein
MKWNYKTFIFGFWLLFLAFILYVYFFEEQLFNKMFQNYPGVGSPFVNTPRG